MAGETVAAWVGLATTPPAELVSALATLELALTPDAAPDAADVIVVGAPTVEQAATFITERRSAARAQGLAEDLRPVVALLDLMDADTASKRGSANLYCCLPAHMDRLALAQTLRAILRGRNHQKDLLWKIEQVRKSMLKVTEARFRFRTLEEGRQVAWVLAQACPRSEQRITGFIELLTNAVEHGNLGLGYSLKSALLESGDWEGEIGRRLALPENADKFVDVWLRRSDRLVEVVITDQGQGFRHANMLDEALNANRELHGRGIALARAISFDALEYRGSGNQVVVRVGEVDDDQPTSRSVVAAQVAPPNLLSMWDRTILEDQLDSVLEKTSDERFFEGVLSLVLVEMASPSGFFGHLDDKGELVCPSVMLEGREAPPSGDAKTALPRSRWAGPWGVALREKHSVIKNESHASLGGAPVLRSLGTPILHRGLLLGALVVANKPQDYSPRDQARLECVARRIAPVLAARLASDRDLRQARRFEVVERTFPGLIFRVDARLNIVASRLNAGPASILGQLRTHPKNLAQLRVFEGWVLLLKGLVASLATSGGSVRFELTRSDYVLDVEICATDAGEVTLLLKDVTTEKLFRKTLEQRERFFSLGSDAFCIIEYGRVARLNSAFTNILGWTEEDLVGKELEDIVHPEDRAALVQAQKALHRGEGSLAGIVYRCRSKAGEYRDMEWTEVAAGNSLYASARDVTEQRRNVALLATQNNQLRQLHEDTVHDHAIAKNVLSNIIRAGSLDAPFVRYSMSPLAVFNGDVALAAETPEGTFRWLLADFAGHGLSGAIGTIPMAQTFYATARKGVPLVDTLTTLNASMKAILPASLFCAVMFLEIDAAGRKLTILNAGMPDLIVLRRHPRELMTVPSNHVPLGVLHDSPTKWRAAVVEVEPGDRVLAYSDGLVEERNPAGQMLGTPALLAALGATTAHPERAFDTALALAETFRAGGAAQDDTSLLEVVVTAAPRVLGVLAKAS